MRSLIRLNAALALLALAGSPALADRYWVTNSNGNFADTANWSDTNGGASGFSVPDLTQATFFSLSGASPYVVNFTADGASNTATFTNNVVTLDINAFKYSVGDASTGGHDFIVDATGTGTASATLVEGTVGMGSLPPFSAGVQVLNFARVRGVATSGGAKLAVDGSGSVFWAGQTQLGIAASGATPAQSALQITNSGTYHSISDAVAAGPASILVSGSGSLMTAYSLGIGGNYNGTLDVTSGGTLRMVSAAGFGSNGFDIGFVGIATLDSGTIETNGSSSGLVKNHGTLRGNGTIKRAATASGLGAVRQDSYETGNFSRIRPGDLSATPAVGTLNLEDTNLTFSTFGPAGSQQTIFLDIASPSSYDRILLTDPGANDGVVTANLVGSIQFNNIGTIDFTAPTSLDFIQAENIVDAGFTTNLATVAAAWTYNGGSQLAYTFGIVTVAADDVRLRLTVVPEPASFALMAAGVSLALFRRR